MKKINYHYLISLVGLLILYFVASTFIDNELLIPKLSKYGQYIKTLKFNEVLGQSFVTIFRTLMSYSLSIFFALILAMIANLKKLDSYINPVISILKTIPTISIILIAFIWFGMNRSVLFIGFLVIFPILYEMFYNRIKSVDKHLLEVCQVYEFPFIKKVKYLYFYSILESFFLSLKQTFGLAFKIMVMSEVIGQTKRGIGIQIYNEKVNLSLNSMVGVFTWTLILIMIVLLIDLIIERVSRKVLKWR